MRERDLQALIQYLMDLSVLRGDLQSWGKALLGLLRITYNTKQIQI